jgi:hypothetical protein
MKTQEMIKNDEVDSQADALTDLPVTDEQANQSKAGEFQPQGRLYIGTEVGVWR